MSERSIQQGKKGTGKFSKIWALLAFIGVSLVLLLIGIRLFQDEGEGVAMGEKPPNFELTSFSGETIRTSDLRGKVVLINFWASWCTPCEEEAQMLEEAWQFYQTEYIDEVVFLGVAYMDTENASLSFLSDYGVTYPNGPDLGSEISSIYQVNAVPETYILDEDGSLQYVKFGPFVALEEILAAVKKVQISGDE